jgi:hypothetical protein
MKNKRKRKKIVLLNRDRRGWLPKKHQRLREEERKEQKEVAKKEAEA